MGLYIGIGVGVVLFLLIASFVLTYNSLVKSRNKVEQAFADIDVILKKRYDLIPNLVNTVKGYAKHEKETLTDLTTLRTTALNSKDIDEVVDANNKISSSVNTILAVAENYPNLKTSSNFLSLQNSLSEIENELSSFRVSYNNYVTNYNTKIQQFPKNILAKIFSFKQHNLFAIVNEIERENVKVEF